ncbi:Enolase-phosphatase E1 [Pseudolycoriella hygida]|uniref:Enolase-phosphatase E1 n=1 Tax=Pseudolycoriella hygida TaxID=35572 RepID=A0A9Q0S1P4_9DIPT|nr:Enolase-phosphatase E1 [Pseudolycoriella hygida]
MPVKAIISDIEGTTTSISFVKDKLFPYAVEHVQQYLDENWNEADVQETIKELRIQYADDVINKIEGAVAISDAEGKEQAEQVAEIVANVKWQISIDRKTTSLKKLQGLIWAKGYNSGAIKGHVYSDVPKAFERWTADNIKIYIYSSGSVAAQKLLFANSEHGDLTSKISGYFDTQIGAKQDKHSYEKIVKEVGCEPVEILFLTDIINEAVAAKESGINVAILVREGNGPLTDEQKADNQLFTSFDDIQLECTAVKRKLEEVVTEASAAKIPKLSDDETVTAEINTGTTETNGRTENNDQEMEVHVSNGAENETMKNEEKTEKITAIPIAKVECDLINKSVNLDVGVEDDDVNKREKDSKNEVNEKNETLPIPMEVVDEKPDEIPAAEKPVTEVSANEEPAAQVPTSEAPAAEVPSAEVLAETPAVDVPQSEIKHTEEQPTEVAPIETELTDAAPIKAASTESARPTEASLPTESANPTESTGTESAPTASAPTESAVVETSVTESAVTESAVTESAVTESAVTESAVTESAVTESAVTESAVTESAATVTESTVIESTVIESTVTESSPTESATTEAAPTEAAPTETAPTETAPTEAVPNEADPTKEAPAEATPPEVAPPEVAPTETVPTETVPTETVSAETVPTEIAPAEVSPTEVSPVEVAPTEVAPIEVAAPADGAPSEITATEVAATKVTVTETTSTEVPVTEVPTTDVTMTDLSETPIPVVPAPEVTAPEVPASEDIEMEDVSPIIKEVTEVNKPKSDGTEDDGSAKIIEDISDVVEQVDVKPEVASEDKTKKMDLQEKLASEETVDNDKAEKSNEVPMQQNGNVTDVNVEKENAITEKTKQDNDEQTNINVDSESGTNEQKEKDNEMEVVVEKNENEEKVAASENGAKENEVSDNKENIPVEIKEKENIIEIPIHIDSDNQSAQKPTIIPATNGNGVASSKDASLEGAATATNSNKEKMSRIELIIEEKNNDNGQLTETTTRVVKEMILKHIGETVENIEIVPENV